MSFITGSARAQIHRLPPAIENYVSADNPVRFIEAFVAKLDLQAAGFLFPKAPPQGRCRPADDPADRPKLYRYGYLNQLRASRQLDFYGGQLLAIDSTKIKALHAADRNWSLAKLDKQRAQTDARLADYLRAPDQANKLVGPRLGQNPVTSTCASGRKLPVGP